MRPTIGRPTILVGNLLGDPLFICGHEFPGGFVHVDGIGCVVLDVCVCVLCWRVCLRVGYYL